MDKSQRRRAALTIGSALLGMVALAGFAAEGCSGDDTAGPGPDGGGSDSPISPTDSGPGADTGPGEAGPAVGPCAGGKFTSIDAIYANYLKSIDAGPIGGDGGVGDNAVLISAFDNVAFNKGALHVAGPNGPWIGNPDPNAPDNTEQLAASTDDGVTCPGAAKITYTFNEYGQFKDNYGSPLQIRLTPAANGDSNTVGSVITGTKLHFSAKLTIDGLGGNDAGSLLDTFSGAGGPAGTGGVGALLYWDKFNNGTFYPHTYIDGNVAGDYAGPFPMDGNWHQYTLDLVASSSNPAETNIAGTFRNGFVNTIVLQVATNARSTGVGGSTGCNCPGTACAAPPDCDFTPGDQLTSEDPNGITFLPDGGNPVTLTVLWDDVWLEGPGAGYTQN